MGDMLLFVCLLMLVGVRGKRGMVRRRGRWGVVRDD